MIQNAVTIILRLSDKTFRMIPPVRMVFYLN
jgi:hypothetical protein